MPALRDSDRTLVAFGWLLPAGGVAGEVQTTCVVSEPVFTFSQLREDCGRFRALHPKRVLDFWVIDTQKWICRKFGRNCGRKGEFARFTLKRNFAGAFLQNFVGGIDAQGKAGVGKRILMAAID